MRDSSLRGLHKIAALSTSYRKTAKTGGKHIYDSTQLGGLLQEGRRALDGVPTFQSLKRDVQSTEAESPAAWMRERYRWFINATVCDDT
jgi:hypothetical protein